MATRDFDMVEFLTCEDSIATYLKLAAEQNDDVYVTLILQDVSQVEAL